MRNEFNKHNHNIININCSIIQFKTPSLEIRGDKCVKQRIFIRENFFNRAQCKCPGLFGKIFDAFSISPDAHGT